MSRYRDPLLIAVENYSYLFTLGPNIVDIYVYEHTFQSQYQRLDRLVKEVKNE